MAPNLVLVFMVVIGVMLFISWLRRSPPALRSQFIRRVWMVVGIAVLVLLVVRGNWLVAVLAAGIPLVQRLLTVTQLYGTLKSLFGSARGLHPGRMSEVKTQFLRMALDHDSGKMTGEVIGGPYSGHRLDELELEVLQQLVRDYHKLDPQSASLLEAYLERVYGGEWRAAEESGREQGSGADRSGPMSREEAYAVLGLNPGASRQQIIEAHRRLMQKVHPDRGGSNFLAAKINEAKAILLGT